MSDDELPQPNLSPEREKLNQLMRSHSLEGVVARNLMLALLKKKQDDRDGLPDPDGGAEPVDIDTDTLPESLQESPLTRAIDHDVEAGVDKIGSEALDLFTREEKVSLLKDIIHDWWSQSTISAATFLCAHHLDEAEIAGILAGTATIVLYIKHRRLIKKARQVKAARAPVTVKPGFKIHRSHHF